MFITLVRLPYVRNSRSNAYKFGLHTCDLGVLTSSFIFTLTGTPGIKQSIVCMLSVYRDPILILFSAKTRCKRGDQINDWNTETESERNTKRTVVVVSKTRVKQTR